MRRPERTRRPGPALVIVLALAGAALGSGCSTVGYYARSIGGHLQIVASARPVADWLADPQTSPTLRERLVLSQRIRDFAVTELGEPDNQSYRRYVDLKRPAAVWNVVAAPELSLTLQTSCFVIVGCVGYRGYYDLASADAFAAEQRAAGLETSVYAVPAYSTLGVLPFDWLADPLLSTFIGYPEGELARLIFHELAHQIAYAKGDTVFNESFATTVERIGGERWLAAHADARARADFERQDARRKDFRELTFRYRAALDALYRSDATDADKRVRKRALFDAMRADYALLKKDRWGGFSGYDDWFAKANNASLGVLAAYNEQVPNFMRLFDRSGGDFGRFYAEVRRLAALAPADRRAALER